MGNAVVIFSDALITQSRFHTKGAANPIQTHRECVRDELRQVLHWYPMNQYWFKWVIFTQGKWGRILSQHLNGLYTQSGWEVTLFRFLSRDHKLWSLKLTYGKYDVAFKKISLVSSEVIIVNSCVENVRQMYLKSKPALTILEYNESSVISKNMIPTNLLCI